MKFRTFADSAPGPKYRAKGWNCQDNSGVLNFGGIQAVAVADGHGSENCFRSEIGSRLAVDITFQQIKIFCENATDTFSDTGIKNFKYSLANEWRNAARRDWNLRLKNLGANEIRYKSVSEKYKARFTSPDASVVEKYLYTAYGTTLICALSIGTQILIFQIGDGTCVVLNKDGIFSTPVPADSENFLNVTTSLSDENAHLKFRHVVLDCAKDEPAAIFLSTDGLDDCYPYYHNDEHLYKFYADVIIDNMINCGYHDTEKEIAESLLPGMTARASKDDISLAYLVAEDIDLLAEAFKNISPEYKFVEEIPAPKSVEKIPAAKSVEKIPAAKSVEKIPAPKNLPVQPKTKGFVDGAPYVPIVQSKILRSNQTVSTAPQIIPVHPQKEEQP